MYCCNVETTLFPLVCGCELQLCWLNSKGSHVSLSHRETGKCSGSCPACYITSVTKKTSLNCLTVVLTCNVE